MEDIDIELPAFPNIICSHHKIINDIFMAVSYHTDLSVHRLMYDFDRKVAITQMGPFVRQLIEYNPDDIILKNIFGSEVFNALTEHTKKEFV